VTFECPFKKCTYTAVGHWVRGFKSRLRHGYVSALVSVVLSCVGRRCTMGQSTAQGVLPKCLKGFIVSEVTADSGIPETYKHIRQFQIC
jgi:hypothetical protein